MEQKLAKQLLICGEAFLREHHKKSGDFLMKAKALRDLCVDQVRMKDVLERNDTFFSTQFPDMELKLQSSMLYCISHAENWTSEVLLCAEKGCNNKPERMKWKCSPPTGEKLRSPPIPLKHANNDISGDKAEKQNHCALPRKCKKKAKKGSCGKSREVKVKFGKKKN